MSNRGSRDAKREYDRRRRFWGAAQIVVGGWLRNRFNLSLEDFEPADIEGPILVAINHASAYDPLFVGVAFRHKPLTFIASEHILRSKWGKLLDRYISIIPHRKGAGGSRTALVAMKRMKKGESVFLAVEGEQTWDGKNMPVMPYTGRLVKASGATLVTYVIEGAYLSAPRWALSTRRGKVTGHPAGVYGPEVLKEMSDEEVEALIAKDLAFDTWEWQKSRPDGPVIYKCRKGGLADGLERFLFTCPECGAMCALRADGDRISCRCGFKVRMLGTGFFGEGSAFATLADWAEQDKRTLDTVLKAKLLEGTGEGGRGAAGEDIVFTDDEVVLHRINDGHRDEEAARGTLSLRCEKDRFMLWIGDFCFDLREISNMTMVLANRIVFSDASGYYELIADKKSRTNLIKYVIARNLVSDWKRGSEQKPD